MDEIEGPWASIHVICQDSGLKAAREIICRRVLDSFESRLQIDSQPRVVCIFDNQDHPRLKQECGRANRGVHWPIKRQRINNLWPQYTHNIIAPPDRRTGGITWPFASVIYLHGSTCENDIGLTLTFAHELQHFLQYVHEKPLWAVNQLLTKLGSGEFKVWWDFPIEIQARITSKRVAEELYGKKAVSEYISSRIAAHITDTDAEDWRYIQNIDSSVDYSLAEGTKALVRRHREQLEIQLRSASDQDFASLDLDALS